MNKSLWQITPSIFNTLGLDTENLLDFSKSSGAREILYLIDGLGLLALEKYREFAPNLSAMNSPHQMQTSFPATTATSISSIGLGSLPGEHGMLGYTVRIPYSDNRLLNALKWDARVDARTWQPTPTLFERAMQAGINVSNISASRYESSGFTEAVLRGATFRGANNFDSMRYELKNALKDAPAFVYLYSNEVDVAGHKEGVGSDSWITALSAIDHFVGQLISDLPAGTRLWVTADHGMVNSEQPVILNHLSDEVLLLGGEPRARHIYLHEAAIKDADSRWKDALGDLAQVISKQEAVDTKLFGTATSSQALNRMGDLILIANSDVTLIEPARAVQESAMVGHHGALSDEERLIPFLSQLN